MKAITPNAKPASVMLEGVCLDYPIYGFRRGARTVSAPQNVGAEIAKHGGHNVVSGLSDITLTAKQGDRIGIVGDNGSGKTTLLKLIGGIYEPTAGQMRVHGKTMGVFNANIGTNQEASGRENIYLRGLMAGLSRRQIEAKMPEIMDFCELGEFIDLPVRTYSQGMAVRLAFGTITALDPEILVLDEWMGAGDASFRERAAKRMQRFVERAGILFLASHNHPLLRDNCNYCAWMKGGHLHAFGPIAEVLSEYEGKKK